MQTGGLLILTLFILSRKLNLLLFLAISGLNRRLYSFRCVFIIAQNCWIYIILRKTSPFYFDNQHFGQFLRKLLQY